MKVKIFTPNKDGKIEFNQKDLESLLNEIYEEGYNDGKKNNSGGLNYPAGVRKIEDNNPFKWDYPAMDWATSTSTTSTPKSVVTTSNIISNDIDSSISSLNELTDTISIEYAKY